MPFAGLNPHQSHDSKSLHQQEQPYGATSLPLAAALNDSAFLARVGGLAALVNPQGPTAQQQLSSEVMRLQRTSTEPFYYDLPSPGVINHQVFNSAQQCPVGDATQQRTSIDASYYGLAKPGTQPALSAYPGVASAGAVDYYSRQYGSSLYRNSSGVPDSTTSPYQASAASYTPSLFGGLSDPISTDPLHQSSVNVAPMMSTMGIRFDSQALVSGTAEQGAIFQGASLQSGLLARPTGQPGFGNVTRTVSLPTQSQCVAEQQAYLARTSHTFGGHADDQQQGRGVVNHGALQRARHGSGEINGAGVVDRGMTAHPTTGYSGLAAGGLNRQPAASGEGRDVQANRLQEAVRGKFASQVPLTPSWDLSWQRLKGRE
jgi:hypothetical protein